MGDVVASDDSEYGIIKQLENQIALIFFVIHDTFSQTIF